MSTYDLKPQVSFNFMIGRRRGNQRKVSSNATTTTRCGTVISAVTALAEASERAREGGREGGGEGERGKGGGREASDDVVVLHGCLQAPRLQRVVRRHGHQRCAAPRGDLSRVYGRLGQTVYDGIG